VHLLHFILENIDIIEGAFQKKRFFLPLLSAGNSARRTGEMLDSRIDGQRSAIDR
jgi:hypothetical protein